MMMEYYLNEGREEARMIANNAKVFASKYLSPESIQLFCKMLLLEYSKLYQGSPPLDASFRLREAFDENDPIYF